MVQDAGVSSGQTCKQLHDQDKHFQHQPESIEQQQQQPQQQQQQQDGPQKQSSARRQSEDQGSSHEGQLLGPPGAQADSAAGNKASGKALLPSSNLGPVDDSYQVSHTQPHVPELAAVVTSSAAGVPWRASSMQMVCRACRGWIDMPIWRLSSDLRASLFCSTAVQSA